MSKRHLTAINIAAILILIFLISFLPNESYFFFFKLIAIFAGIGAVYYILTVQANTTVSEPEDEQDPPTPDSITISTPDRKLHLQADRSVEEHFEDFLDVTFPLIKQTLVSDTVVLLMLNFQKKQFYMRRNLSQHTDLVTRSQYLDLHRGLPALILKSKKSLLENHLPDSENLLPYYSSADIPAKSFIGVPMYFDETVIGVLCADSSVEQSYSPEDLQIFTHYSNLLSIQIACSNKLYEYETENWTIKMLYQFSKEVLGLHTSDELWTYLSRKLESEFDADRIVICERSEKRKGMVIQVFGSPATIRPGQSFPDDGGIIGWVMRKHQPLMVEDFTAKPNYIPRFQLNEQPVRQIKSLLAVPVQRRHGKEMVISLESEKVRCFTEQHKQILETMAYQIASFLDKCDIIERLESENVIDRQTTLGNDHALNIELDKEVRRANQQHRSFSIAMLRIANADRFRNSDLLPSLVDEFVSFTLPLFNNEDYIFRFSADTFALLWPDSALEEVQPAFQRICDQLEKKRGWVNGLIEQIRVKRSLVQYPTMGSSRAALIEAATDGLEIGTDPESELPGTMVSESEPESVAVEEGTEVSEESDDSTQSTESDNEISSADSEESVNDEAGDDNGELTQAPVDTVKTANNK